MQVGVASGHTIPHPPQFIGSVVVLTSHPFAGLLSQFAKPALQEAIVHVPAVQAGVPFATKQTEPQEPQLLGSVDVFTHVLPQSTWPAGQVQTPLTHDVPIGQACPHMPQLLGSVEVLTHVVPQRTSPGGQVHMPLEHTSPIEHTCPHMPQFIGSVAGLMQMLPQTICPIGHCVVEVVLLVVVVVVVVAFGLTPGAQRIFGVLGCTVRMPNWSCTLSPGSAVALFGHFTA